MIILFAAVLVVIGVFHFANERRLKSRGAARVCLRCRQSVRWSAGGHWTDADGGQFCSDGQQHACL